MHAHEWSFRDLWDWMSWPQRLDLIVLAVMFAYVIVVVVDVSSRIARHAKATDTANGEFQRGHRKLASDLSIKVRTLDSIALVAPYLGLAGACIGILAGFEHINVQAESALAAVIHAAVVPVALTTTLSGLLVVIAATWCHNYLRTRIDSLGMVISSGLPMGRSPHSGFVQKFPLAARFSRIPLALVLVSSLTILTGLVFMEYASYRSPMGLYVSVVPADCDYEGERLVVLRLTSTGGVFINQTQEDWNSLSEVLSQIYSFRVHRTLYLLVEDGVPYQTVADALDIVKNAHIMPHQEVRTGADELDITVRLITPRAMQTSCLLEPAAIGSSRHPAR